MTLNPKKAVHNRRMIVSRGKRLVEKSEDCWNRMYARIACTRRIAESSARSWNENPFKTLSRESTDIIRTHSACIGPEASGSDLSIFEVSC